MTRCCVSRTCASVVDFEAAEGEGDAARHRVSLERRIFDRHRPVRLRDIQTYRATAVLGVGAELHIARDRGVVGLDRLDQRGSVHVLELAASSSIEFAVTLVTRRARYSGRSRCVTDESKICQAN